MTLRFATPRNGRGVTKCFDMDCFNDADLVIASTCVDHGTLLSSYCLGCWQRWVQPNLGVYECGDVTPEGICARQIQTSEPVAVSGPDSPFFADVELVS